MIVPHEQFGVFSLALDGDTAGHDVNGGTVAFLPSFLESGAGSFQAEIDNLPFQLPNRSVAPGPSIS